jgi:hypothetical protein
LYTSCVLGLRPFALFYELLLIKKKNKVRKMQRNSLKQFYFFISN